ncbi:calcium-binding protein [Mangrovicoccus sp. HB161399]|uniref:calcium-binding protein n=1 Tax=Mangrovicoccus sp. HB161399 TaxID=2720392 RepID=UPI00155368C4|nr:calcium-binding protein [Mangrovicoccus sp. HB161399]
MSTPLPDTPTFAFDYLADRLTITGTLAYEDGDLVPFTIGMPIFGGFFEPGYDPPSEGTGTVQYDGRVSFSNWHHYLTDQNLLEYGQPSYMSFETPDQLVLRLDNHSRYDPYEWEYWYEGLYFSLDEELGALTGLTHYNRWWYLDYDGGSTAYTDNAFWTFGTPLLLADIVPDDVLVAYGTDAGEVHDFSDSSCLVAFNALGGDDHVTGSAFGDQLVGGLGYDTILGGAGGDTIKGGINADRIFEGGGDGLVYGDEGADVIDGGDGADTIFGGDGGDLLRSGTGDGDALWGQLGRDQLVLQGENGKAGGGLGDDTVTATGGAAEIYGGFGNDLLTGGDAADRIDGGADSDTLRGGGGNDLLFGRDGDDRLRGGLNADLIDGGMGNDTMIGGFGADTFVLEAGLAAAQQDVVLDFEAGIDQVVLGTADSSAWTLETTATDTVLTFLATGATVTFEGTPGLGAENLFL